MGAAAPQHRLLPTEAGWGELEARRSLGAGHALPLMAWNGLSYEEVAEALGIPAGTVRSRISRALFRRS